jgi:hypothetical protein
VNAEALALKLEFTQAVLSEKREEVAQLLHRELLRRAARLVLLPVSATPSVTFARHAAGAFRLSG